MYKDPEKQRLFQREWQRKQRVKNKERAVKMLGGCCGKCGYSENINALQVDHIVPVLRKERENQTGGDFYRKVANGFISLEGLQLLCANCHAIKTYEEDRKNFKQYVK